MRLRDLFSRQVALGVVLFTLVAGATAWGQATASLNGTVTDPTGAVIPGASVALTNQATGASRSTVTADNGGYIFTEVPPGLYTVKVSLPGFKTAVRENIALRVATPTTLDIQLEVGEITETVTVEVAAIPINTVDATIGDTFSERQVKELPLAARNPLDLLTLQPGVVVTGESNSDLLFMGSTSQLDQRDGVVNGIRSNQTNVTLDGVDANDQESQAAFTSVLPVTLDSLQEFRVVTTNANASEGVSGGAQTALVTKSGSNEFHGNLRELHRNTRTAANTFFNKKNEPDPIEKPKLLRNIFGFSVGGPLVKERAFFFWDWEGRRDSSESTELRSIPTETLKRGIFRYESTTGQVIELSPAQFAALDPGCNPPPGVSSAGCGVNPAMLRYMSLFPVGNAPKEGLDLGLNFTGFRFKAPIKTNNNIYTTRFDFNLTRDGRHAAFWRGTLGDIKTDILAAQLPGQPPRGVLLNNSKGFAVGYTAQFTPNITNAFRWGLTRQGIEQTGNKGAFFGVRSYSTPSPFNRAFGRRVPVHTLREDITWVKGSHLFQGGANIRFIRNDRFTEAISFPSFSVNNGFCQDLCRDAWRALLRDGDPNNDPADVTAFVRSFMMLTGSITTVSASFFVDPKKVSFLPLGTTQAREFAENDFEFYFQDSWRVKSNLTLTFGLRYSYFSPVWETRGFQVRPTVDVEEWWDLRQKNMNQGIPSDASPLLEFLPAGKANGKAAWWDPDTNNFAPRFSLAYSPNFNSGFLSKLFGGPGKSSFRAGFGIFHSRVGGSLAVTNDTEGSPGLSNSLINPVAQFGLADAPRFGGTCTTAGCSGLPPLDIFLNIPTATFPATPTTFSDNVGFLVNTNLVTPYSMNFSFSFSREVAKGLAVEAAYVGTLGRKLLTKTDFAQLMGFFKDPKSGETMWGAYNRIIDAMGDIFNPNPISSVAPIPFFENTMPNLAGAFGRTCGRNLTATQVFYCLATLFAPTWSDLLFFLDVSLPLAGFSPWSAALDPEGNGLGGSGIPGRVLFQQQFNSLAGWVNWGSSNFHSLQLSVRKSLGNNIFMVNYVLSKSLDNGSAPENADLFAPLGQFNGQIPNPLAPKAHRSFSDFDLRHNFNANWVVQLPVGRGRSFGSNISGWLDQIIGGWQVMGAWRMRSGPPLSPANGFNFPTNFFLTGPGTFTAPIKSSVTKNDPNGQPNLFEDPEAILKLLTFTRPGDVGTRNVIRSDNFFSVDLGVSKVWKLPWGEGHSLQFRWEAFNLFNNVNFDTNDVSINPEAPSLFGRFFSTAGSFPTEGAREMQFALRYIF